MKRVAEENGLDQPIDTLTLAAAMPRVLLANHFAFTAGQVEGPWAAASRLLIYVRSGEGHITFRDGTTKVAKGDFLQIGWGEPVKYAAPDDNGFSIITVHYVPHLAPSEPTPKFKHIKSKFAVYQHENVSRLVPELSAIVPRGSLVGMPHLLLILERMIEEVRRPSDQPLVHEALLTGYIKVLLAELLDLSTSIKQPTGNPRVGDILRVREYLDFNYQKPLNRKWMAEMAGMSPAHFTRTFASVTGLTPHRYLIERRLSEVQSLLRMTAMSLKQIAARTGFATAFHLSHAFKEAYGLSPHEYRQQSVG